MSDEPNQPTEIVIVRRRGGNGDDGHHGGVWKIAFADFMTAMMAFFLVLWIVNSTSKETRSSVARYFNPVKLAETSPARKGLQDPKEADFDAASDASPKKAEEKKAEEKKKEEEKKHEKEKPADHAKAEPTPPAKSEAAGKPSPAAVSAQEKAAAGEMAKQAGVALPKTASPTAIREMSAMEDPMSVLDEIAGQMDGPQPLQRADGVPVSAPSDTETRLTFKDPFEPIAPTMVPRKDLKSEGLRGSMSQPDPKGSQPPPAAAAQEAVPPVTTSPNASAALVQQANRLRQALNQAMKQEGLGKDSPQVEISVDSEGVLISLTDSAGFAMFNSASPVPQPQTVKLLTEVGKKLKEMKGSIVLRGHTDSRPFKAGANDNWRLSSTRAQMAFYMLVRGGLDEKRVERVEGWADRRPKNTRNPASPENRRIEILLRQG